MLGGHGLLVAVIAIALPVAGRLLYSPISLVVLAPVIAVGLVCAFIGSNLIMGLVLQNSRPDRTSAQAQLRGASRPLAFTTPAAWQAVHTRSKWTTSKHASITPNYPSISPLLDRFIAYIIRDFVMVWYSNISPSQDFPNALEDTIYVAAEKVVRRIENIDLPSLLVRRILPKVTAHVEKFRQSEVALRGVGLERHLTQSDQLDILLASKYSGKDGRLHPAVENLASPVTKQTEQAHLRGLLEKILPLIVPEKDISSKAVAVIARELVACVVLMPVMEMFADPDFWNRTIDQAAGAAIRQQKLISKVRNILENQSPVKSLSLSNPSSDVQPGSPSRGPRMEDITSKTGASHFESFLQSIRRCNSLLDTRRLKNDISGEIRRTRLVLANHEKDEWIKGEKASDVVAYLDRLYSARKLTDERIAALGGRPDDEPSLQADPRDPTRARIALRDVLTSPSSLSYFMEFMDRRSKSPLVQFWLTVESFKNPLEEIDSASSGEDEDEDLLNPPAPPPASTTIKDDMSMIYELYFSNMGSSTHLSAISQKHIDTIRAYVIDSTSPYSAAREKRVRKSVLLAQRQVEKQMEEDFQEFERSELGFKAISDLEPRKNGVAHQPLLYPSHSQPSPLQSPPAGPLPPPRPSNAPRSASRPTFIFPPKPMLSEVDTAKNLQKATHPPKPSRRASASPSTKSNTGHQSNLAFLISASGSDSVVDAPRAPLFGETEEGDNGLIHQETIEALQAALTDIIAHENEESERFRHRRQSPTGSDGFASPQSSIRGSGVRNRRDSSETYPQSAQPENTTADHGDSSLNGRRLEDAPHEQDGATQRGLHVAAPGDLQLSSEINRLTEKINKLLAQETILDALIRKAELTGDADELKILSRSKSSMNRELRELTFQRSQYEQQEAENRLAPDRTKISISSPAIVGEENGKQVVRYLVEIQQLAPDGSFASGWVVARRYNEFHTMHQRLREKFALVKNLEFPPKKLVTSMSSSFVDTRRLGLEKYMQSIVAIPLICESEELRAFLSRQIISSSPAAADGSQTSKPTRPGTFLGQGLVRTVYRSVADSIDDIFFGPSMLDVMIQRLSQQAAEFAGIVGSGVHDEELIAQALKANDNPEETLLNLSSGDLKPLEGESSMSVFSAPICDLILAVFELDKKNNWLRKQAIVIILQQVLGGTIERKLREGVRTYLDEDHIVRYLTTFMEELWPGGNLKPPTTARSGEEKTWTRDQANRKLSALMPDLAANMIGRSNARRGAGRMFAVLQNKRLNQHITYCVLDEVLAAIFPEAQLAP